MIRLRPIAASLLFLLLMINASVAQMLEGAAADRVQIELRGTILPRCEMSGAPSVVDIGEALATEPEGSRQFNFQLSCNAPFSYSLASRGALRGESGAAPAGFSSELPYRAVLIIEANGGASLMLDCDSAALGEASGCTAQSGDRIAIDQPALLKLSWGQLARPLAAGLYTDDLRIAFSVGN